MKDKVVSKHLKEHTVSSDLVLYRPKKFDGYAFSTFRSRFQLQLMWDNMIFGHLCFRSPNYGVFSVRPPNTVKTQIFYYRPARHTKMGQWKPLTNSNPNFSLFGPHGNRKFDLNERKINLSRNI